MKEGFNYEAYRDNLAQELQDPDLSKKEREMWLESEKDTDEYQAAEQLHAQDRAEVQRQSRERTRKEIAEKINELQNKLAQLNRIDDEKSSGAKIIEMATAYRDNFEREELWSEFKTNAAALFRTYKHRKRELEESGTSISYDPGQMSREMFDSMRTVFEIPESVTFGQLESSVQDQFRNMRIALERDNNFQQRKIVWKEGGF